MKRRDFLKSTCSFCVLASSAFVVGSLSSCRKLPIYKTAINENKIAIPVSLFAQTDFKIVRPLKFLYDIALRKEKDGAYTAQLLCCTHAENQLVSTGDGYVCNLHGSKFDKEGKVTKGPAEHSLKKYATEVNDDYIIIFLK